MEERTSCRQHGVKLVHLQSRLESDTPKPLHPRRGLGAQGFLRGTTLPQRAYHECTSPTDILCSLGPGPLETAQESDRCCGFKFIMS